jgi:hypothetical protein
MHGDEIGILLGYEGGYLHPLMKKLVKYNILLAKPGTSKQHRARYFAANEETLKLIESIYTLLSDNADRKSLNI